MAIPGIEYDVFITRNRENMTYLQVYLKLFFASLTAVSKSFDSTIPGKLA